MSNTKPSGTYTGGTFSSSGVPDSVTCATVRDFVMVAPTANRYSVRWSALGAPTDWPTPGTDDARTKLSGEQVFPNKSGYVTGISGNDFYAYVFQERAISKATFVGGDIQFSFNIFEEGRGCFQVNRIARVDDITFFESEFGYHMLENDRISDIGYGAVDDSYTPASEHRF